MIAYKYRSGRGIKDSEGNDVFERDIDLLSRDTIYIPTVAQLNDPAEAFVDDSIFKIILQYFKKQGYKDSIELVEESYINFNDKIRSSGIYSLSKKIDSELMWAYYASGHSGYAIIIDTKVLSKSFNDGEWGGMYEFDIKYSSKLPRFDINKVTKNELIKVLSCFVGYKSKAWKHEDEHRLVFDKGGDFIKIDYRAIKGFVFGCRMKEEDIDYVMKTFSGRDYVYFKVVLKDGSYKLSLKELTDKYPTSVKYSPNNVVYDIEALLEGDKFSGGVGDKYRSFVEEALREVSKEPFVTGIYILLVTDDKEYPNILIWANIKQDGNFRPVRSFEYDIRGGQIIRTK